MKVFILTRNSPHHHIALHHLSCPRVRAIFPSQRPGAVPPLRGPTATTGEVAASDVPHSDTSLSLNSLPVSPGAVLDVLAQLHPVVLQHLVDDSEAVVPVLINTVQAKFSGFFDQPKIFYED